MKPSRAASGSAGLQACPRAAGSPEGLRYRKLSGGTDARLKPSRYDRTRDRPYDAQDVRPIRKTYPLGTGLILQLGWRTDAELGYARTRYSADDPNDACDPSVNPNCFTIGASRLTRR